MEAQVEGSFVYGLSAALYGACTVKDGAIAQTNFDSYPVMRLAEMPKVETVLVPSGGFWGGDSSRSALRMFSSRWQRYS